jgi:hypothetical protein
MVHGTVSEVGLEIKQLTRIKQSQIKQPWQSVLMLYLNLNQFMGKTMLYLKPNFRNADALSEPIHGKGHALSLAQLPKPDQYNTY